MFVWIKEKIKTGTNILRIFLVSNREKENNYKYCSKQWTERGKIVVYTSITDRYDKLLKVPKLDGVDFVAFVDGVSSEKICSGWKVCDTPCRIDETENGVLRNRFVKLHPFNFFGHKYDYSIYIDGNIAIRGDIRNFLFGINKKTGLALHRHRSRDSVYNEIKACKILKKGNLKKLKEQNLYYKRDGFPANFGLYECNVIAIDLHNKNAKKIMDAWWKEFLRSESMRDQIALPYAVWKLGYKFDDIGSLGDNVYRNPLVKILDHREIK